MNGIEGIHPPEQGEANSSDHPNAKQDFTTALDKLKTTEDRITREIKASRTTAADLAAPKRRPDMSGPQLGATKKPYDSAKPLETAAAATKGYDEALKDRKFGLYEQGTKTKFASNSIERFDKVMAINKEVPKDREQD